ncbi:hypothetical protein C7M84_018116 [Penaeus vannamei]|uniref:Uncharacterized protein n=1 Tax=Penaeus vannamei TaxID=6689 RepID=A0A3R7M0I2_PENVA|nr:hypothetical protein C7M84_018116 [Penaeus vannamei]
MSRHSREGGSRPSKKAQGRRNSLCWVSHLCVSRLPLNEASKGRRTCALRKRVAHGAKHPAHKTGLGAVAHLVGPGDPGGADKDFWVRPPPSPGGGEKEAGEPCREPPVDGTEPSQPASQRDREMEEQRRAARLHGRAPSQTSPPNWGMGGRAGPDGAAAAAAAGSRRGSPPAARSRGSPPVVVGAGPQPTRPRAGAARPRGPRKAAPPTAPAARTPQSLPRFRGREPERQGQTKQHTTPNPPKNATRNGALAATRAARLGSGGKQASKHKREPAGGELAKPVARGRGGTLAGPVSFSTCLTHGSAGGGAWDCRGFLPFSPQGCAHPGSNSALPAKRGRGEKNPQGAQPSRGEGRKRGRHSETIPNVKRGAVACVKGRTTADTGGGGTGTGYPRPPVGIVARARDLCCARFGGREIRGRDRRPSLPRAQDGAQTPKRHHTPRTQHDRKQGEDALRTPHHPRPGKRLTLSRVRAGSNGPPAAASALGPRGRRGQEAQAARPGARPNQQDARTARAKAPTAGVAPAARAVAVPLSLSARALSPHDRGQGPLGPGGHGRQPLRRPRQPGPPKACPAFGDGSRKGRGRQNNIRLQTPPPRRTPHAMGPWPQLALQGSAPEASKQASTNGSRQEAS